MENSIKENEINIIELVKFIWNKKIFIALITSFFSCLAIIYSLLVTPLWNVTSTVRSTSVESQLQISNISSAASSLIGVSLGEAIPGPINENILMSRNLVERFIEQNDLVQELLGNEYIDQNNQLTQDQLLYRATTIFIDNVVTFSSDPSTQLIDVNIRWYDPFVAFEWNLGIIELANETIRQRDLNLANSFNSFLNAELSKTNSIELRQSIATMIQSQMQTIMLANSSTEYAFTYIDPPRIPDSRAYPRRMMMVILSFIASLIFSIVCLIAFKNFIDQK